MLFEKTITAVSPAREKEILAFWAKDRIFWESMKIRENGPRFVFFEGPPTANGAPHPGHVLTKAMKDLIPRYKTMCGFYVGRKAGWDTHGLPVELEVERQLGLEGKQDIEKYGIEKFVKKCRESVFKYEKEWRAMVERGGLWVDMDDPYVTCTNNYIESVWWMLGQFWKEGLLYEGHKVVPYCPRCGTALSSHEVAQGYDEVEDPSVFVRFKVKGKPSSSTAGARDECFENTSFLVWTTTPWTLLSNVALAVGKDIDYIKVKVENEYLILAKARWEVLQGKGEIVGTWRGEELKGIDYEPLFNYVKPDKKAHFVITADFVSTGDGTGIVHIAPAFGEDDYLAGKENNLPVLQPVDLAGKFTSEITPWAGRFVKDADPDIIKHLKETGQLLYSTSYKHTYPFCWRCDSPLLYYARRSWFIRTTAFKDQVLANNEKINWFPAHVKEGRFLNFLENMVDWAISRERYWGTPLPIWKCACGHQHLADSIADLKKHSKNCPDDIELHKPYVDQITLTCEKCHGTMKRVPEVIDCWFDSGAMHTAQWHYPFENKDAFEKNFPADFICEAIDQTRGWFYSLLVTSTFLHKASAYKNVVVLGLICDKNGLKMSKSKGNVLDCMALFDKFGADAVRWSLYSGTAPWNTRRFYEDGIAEAQNRFLGTLQNVYSFFVLYANIENFNPREHDSPVAGRSELDRWILSRFNRTVAEVRAAMDIYEITRATQAMESLVEDLSNWYVRRSRRRFWSSENTPDKTAAFVTLHEVLVGLAKLCAPFTPFIAEDIHQNLVRRIDARSPVSVHLTDYPVADQSLIDPDLEKRMSFVARAVALGRAGRNEANLKVRQPLALMKILVQNETERRILEAMKGLIADELNVKDVVAISDVSDLTRFVVKPNFRVIGKGPYKSMIPKIKAHFEVVDGNLVQQKIAAGKYVFSIDDTEVSLGAEEVVVTTQAAGEYVVQSEGGMTVALDGTLTRPLILEGLAREMVNKIQHIRKETGLDVVDRISISYRVEDTARVADIEETLTTHGAYIQQETLARKIQALTDTVAGSPLSSVAGSVWNINGIQVRLAIKKEEGK